ncbi:MAG: hypothetical protein ABFQ65_01345 [Nanoarchaeota archaeon]
MTETIHQIIQRVSPIYKDGKPDTSHTIVYDSSTETLEPIYFYIIELMREFGMTPEKLIDNFTSSPGSGHFGELGQRATIMQQQGAKILGDINTVLRSVLNIIYDLKEFKIRLQAYEDLKSKDKKDGAILSLKQIWMDKVDMQKGNSSIKAMALSQAGFQTLIDAFLAAKTSDDIKNLDLNDRVKRILAPRLQDFENWLKHSEGELKKRYELEKNYLRSQVSSLQLYSRWAKPYLIAAQELESSQIGGTRNPELVKNFNTILLELTLMGKLKLNIEEESVSGNLPAEFKKMKPKRDFYSIIIIDFKFRGIPQKVSQQAHFAFGGKAEIIFSSYALHQEELDKFEEELQKSDIEDVLKLIEGTTTDSLDRLQDEINFFLEEKSDEEKKENKDTSNPFLALIGFYNKKEKFSKEKKKEKIKEPIKPDTWIEKKHFRALSTENGKNKAFSLFDIYKKAHKMESFT